MTLLIFSRGSRALFNHELPAHAGSYLLSSLRDYRNVGKAKPS
jgi:hypothetical protein